jgi:hypothetical protein
VKRFVITESDRRSILSMYGIMVEQEEPTTSIPENWSEYSAEIKTYIDSLKTIEVSLKDTKRDKIPYGTSNTENISVDKAIIISNARNGGYNRFKSYMERANLSETEGRKLAVISNFDTLKNLANDFKTAWNNEEGFGKEVIVKIFKSRPETKEFDTPEPRKVQFLFEFKPDVGNTDFYPNNGWQVSDVFTNELNEKVVNPIQQLKQEYPEIKIYLDTLEIYTSSSRFRNTGDAADLSFDQLSGYRNNTAKDYIINVLKENGVLNLDKVQPVQNYLGKNGDGTSGPNPPKGYQYVSGGIGVKMEPPMSDESKREEFDAPHGSPEEYNQHKYLIINMSFRAEDEKVIPVPTPEDLVYFYSYEITVGDTIKTTKPSRIPQYKPKKGSSGLLKSIIDNFKINPEKCAAYD